jgi:hypothetical protein
MNSKETKMAVESKIRELLSGKTPEVVTEEVNELDEAAGSRPADKSEGDTGAATAVRQGSSEDAPVQALNTDGLGGENLGANSANAVSGNAGRGADKTQGDATAPKQGSSEDASTEGQVNKPGTKSDVAIKDAPTGMREEEEAADEEVLDEDITDEEVEAELELDEESDEEVEEIIEEETLFEDDIKNLFADEEHLSEDFKTKAAGLFEAVVTARVTAEVEEIEKELANEASVAQETFKEEMVQKIDSYLNYVAENWMKQNELAIEKGLKSEITESFIGSLKEVFAEHYIEIPEEKYDVLGEMQGEIDSLKSKLDESTEEKVGLVNTKIELEKAAAVKEATADLTVTEQEKFAKLVEEVEFDGDYAEKLSVIKENYFPTQAASDEDKLIDDETITASDDVETPVNRYAQAISRSAKFK